MAFKLRKPKKNTKNTKNSNALTKFLNQESYQQNNIVYMSNALASAKITPMTKLEELLFWFIFSKVKKTKKDGEDGDVEILREKNKKIVFSIKEFLAFADEESRPSGIIYERIKTAILNLSKVQFRYIRKITQKQGKNIINFELSGACNFFESTNIYTVKNKESLDYFHKLNYVEVILTDTLLNELTQLDGSFTRVNAYLCSLMPHKYAPSLFRLAHTAQGNKPLRMSKEHLFEVLNVPKSYQENISKFHYNVLKPATDSINETLKELTGIKEDVLDITGSENQEYYDIRLKKSSVALSKNIIKKFFIEDNKKALAEDAECETTSVEFEQETSAGADNDSNK